jgi:hypothetical protein
VGNPGGKRPLGKASRRWEDNTMMDLREVDSEVMDWIQLARDRDRWRALVNAVMNLRGNFSTSCKPISFSRRTLLHGVSY